MQTDGPKKRIAWLGLGAMGRRMARRLSLAGHEVTVWSRSGVPGGSPELRDLARATPRDCARRAELAFAMVEGDEASRRVWLDPEDGALAALDPGALVVECSTLTPACAAELATRVTAAGCRFLDAPVVGSRPQAEAGSLVALVGGAAADVSAAKPVLATLASAVHALGPTPNGARAKLAVNALFSAQVAMLGELLAPAGLAGLDPLALMEVLGTLPVLSPAAKLAGAAMCAGRFDPLFPVALVLKDLRYAVASAEALGAKLPVTSAVADVFATAAARGFAGENITAVAKVHRP